MRNQEISLRYARALFQLSTDNRRVESVLNQLREVGAAMAKDLEVQSFFTGPTISKETQLKVLADFFQKKNLDEEVRGLLTVLVEKRRFEFLPDIIRSYQAAVDAAQGIARGKVDSASTLLPEERVSLESTISKYTHKKVVLEYHEDRTLVGGLVARVGSYTFDDSLETQLRLMKDSIKKRRAH